MAVGDQKFEKPGITRDADCPGRNDLRGSSGKTMGQEPAVARARARQICVARHGRFPPDRRRWPTPPTQVSPC